MMCVCVCVYMHMSKIKSAFFLYVNYELVFNSSDEAHFRI